MYKLATFSGVAPTGEPLNRIFRPGDSIRKVAGTMMPQIQDWLSAYTPEPGKIAILVNAMGASEYWGQNVNGDIFPENALVHDCRNHGGKDHPYDDFTGKVIPPYGYWTFLTAHPFVHHKNKDPSRAFGKVVVATWNPRMHRVELIIIIDKELALQHGAQHVVDRILAGEYPDCSMGARVPYDTCFPAGTPIITGRGYQPIEEIERNDNVLTHRSVYKGVLETSKRHYKGPMVSLDVWGLHREIVQTSSHLFEVVQEDQLRSCSGSAYGRKRRHSPDENGICKTCKKVVDVTTEWIKASDIQVGDYLVRPFRNASVVKARYDPILARLLGLYLGDGHIIRQRKGRGKTGDYKSVGIGITFGDDNQAVLERFLTECEGMHEVGEIKNLPRLYELKGRNAHVANIYSVSLAEEFEHFGGRGCHNKHINEDVFGWAVEARLAVIGGLIDSDGCQDRNGSMRIVGTNERLMMGVQRLCLSTGILAALSSYISSGSGFGGPQEVFQISIPGSASPVLSDFSAKVKSIHRSSGSAAVALKNCVLVPVQGIHHYEDEIDVYNLQVDGDESYTVCGISVHNCTICGHKSKTRNDYCICITQFGMGKLLDDGRRVGVINTYPRFFDISFVFIGADKTAKVMCKLASGLYVPTSVLEGEEIYGTDSEEELVKAASIQVPKNFYFEKNSEPRIAGVSLEESDRILSKGPSPKVLFGKTDAQLPETKRAIEDGALKTNMDVNESEEGKEQPLYPGRGKTASAGVDILKRLGIYGGIGAGVGGGTGALLSKEDRLKGGLLGAGIGAGSGMLGGGLGSSLGKWVARIHKNPQINTLRSEIAKAEKAQGDILGEARQINARLGNLRFDAPKDVMERKNIQEVLLPSLEKKFAHFGVKKGLLKHTLEPLEAVAGQEARTLSKKVGFGGATLGGAAGGEFGADVYKTSSVEKTAQVGLSELWAKAKRMKIGPPPKPNRKEYPFTGTIDFRGLTIHVENLPGTYREGEGWKTLMRIPYGEFLGTRGVDKDKLDGYVGPYRNAPNVYIVHQNFAFGPKQGKYDEDKIMVGFESAEQAKQAYLSHYNNPKFFRSITTMAFPLFKRAIIKKEVHGEKVATELNGMLEKVAVDLKLEDLFDTKDVRKRQKVWRDHESKKETRVTGSGFESMDRAKTASIKGASSKLELTDQDINSIAKKYGQPPDQFGKAVRTSSEMIWPGGRPAQKKYLETATKSAPPFAKISSKQDELDVVFGREPMEKKAEPFSPRDLLRVSNDEKTASHLKWADIVKEIGPGKAVGKVSPLLSDAEPELPREVLNALGEAGIEKGLTLPSMAGMVLKPSEFQRILLTSMGKGELADNLNDAGAQFIPSCEHTAPSGPLSPDHMDQELLQKVLPMLGDKSYFGPVVRRRIIKITICKPTENQPTPMEVDSPLLSKVAAAYNWYRREQMKLAADAPRVISSIPTLHAGLYGLGDSDLFKSAATKGRVVVNPKTLGVILGAVPLTLMYSAHLRGKQQSGEEMGLLKRLVADHPWLATMGTAVALKKVMDTPQAQQAADEMLAAAGRIWRGKGAPAAVL